MPISNFGRIGCENIVSLKVMACILIMGHVLKQVWEVILWKRDPSKAESRTLIASSRVTLLSNMEVPEHAKDASEPLKKYAKL